MSTSKKSTREAYERTRHAFDELKIEEQVTFVIEATVSTIARGIEDLGQRLADDLDHAFGKAHEEMHEEEEKETKKPPAKPKAKQTRAKRTSSKAKKKPSDDDA